MRILSGIQEPTKKSRLHNLVYVTDYKHVKVQHLIYADDPIIIDDNSPIIDDKKCPMSQP